MGMPARTTRHRLFAAVILFAVFEGNLLYQYAYRSENLFHVDLPSFWAAAQLTFAEGRSPYDYDAMLGYAGVVGRHVFPFLYPPSSLLVLSPLSLVSWPAATGLATTANHLLALVCIALVLGLLARYAREEGLDTLGLFLGASMMTGMPVVNTIVHGQSNLLVLALLCTVWLSLRRGREGMAGAALAVAILLKPTPAIFLLYLAARRSWRALAVACAILATATLASVALLPDGLWTTWLSEVRPTLGYGLQPIHLFSPACPSNQSLNGLFSRLYAEPACVPIEAALPLRGRALTYAAAFVVLAISLSAVWRAHAAAASADAEDLGFCVVLAAMFLTGSLSWEHHLVFVLPGLALLFALTTRGPASAGALLGLGGVALGILVTLPLNHPALLQGWASALISTRTWAVVLLWTMLWSRLCQCRTPHTHNLVYHAHESVYQRDAPRRSIGAVHRVEGRRR